MSATISIVRNPAGAVDVECEDEGGHLLAAATYTDERDWLPAVAHMVRKFLTDTAAGEGTTTTVVEHSFTWEDDEPGTVRKVPEDYVTRKVSREHGDKAYTRTVTTIVGPWTEVE